MSDDPDYAPSWGDQQREADGQDEPLVVDYWKVAAAMCRAVREIRSDLGDDVADSVVNLLTIELDKDYEGLDWANVMTDSWPLSK